MIKLIVNADDFGYSARFDERILELLDASAIRSTTAMVDFVQNDERLIHLRKLYWDKKVGVGLHLVAHGLEPEKDFERQYQKFIALFDLPPTHVDLHKHIHNLILIKKVNAFAELKGLPVRNMGLAAKTKQTSYPALFSTGLLFSDLVHYVESMEEDKSYEILTHPGSYDPHSLSSLNREREKDYDLMLQLHAYLKKKLKFLECHFGEL